MYKNKKSGYPHSLRKYMLSKKLIKPSIIKLQILKGAL